MEIPYPSFTLPVHRSPQNSGVLESHHLSGGQRHSFSGLGVPADTPLLFSYRKFSEPANENVLAALRGLFDRM
jgi:hypothetical protein